MNNNNFPMEKFNSPVLLFRIPHQLLVYIFHTMLSLDDMCRLDTAICNTELRDYFLYCLRSAVFVDRPELERNSWFLTWTSLRQISLTHLKCKPGTSTHSQAGDVTDSCVSNALQTLKSLDLSGCFHISRAGFARLAKICQSLVAVDLSGLTLAEEASRLFARHCPGLLVLNISECKVSASSVQYISRNRPGLLSFDLSWGFTDTIASVIGLFPGVRSLRCSNCVLTDNILLLISKTSSQLRYLDIGDECWRRMGHYQDHSIVQIAEQCKMLRHVEFSCDVGDDGITALAVNCSALESLSLAYNNKVTDSGVRAIPHHCKHLVSMELKSCAKITDVVLFNIATHSPGLERFFMSDMKNITDVGFSVLTKCCVRLKVLSVVDCDDIGDESFCSAAGGKYIDSLNIKGTAITDVGVVTLVKSIKQLSICALEDLKWVSINQSAIDSLVEVYHPNVRKKWLSSSDFVFSIRAQLRSIC